MFTAAAAAAPSWPVMHIAWSLNEDTNFGAISLRSAAVFAHVVTASFMSEALAVASNSFGKPARAALSVASALPLSAMIFASASIVNTAGLHSAWSEPSTLAAAWHCPAAPAPLLSAAAAPEHPPPALAAALADTLHSAGL